MKKFKQIAMAFLLFKGTKAADKSDTKQTKDIRKVFSTMGISANIMSLKKDRALTMRKKRRNEKTSPCERFEKNINLQEKAKNFNFKYDAEEETRRAASTIEKNLFPLSNEGGFQDSVERLKTDDSVDLRQLTTEDVASQRERRETTQENLADQEQDTMHITEQQQELINNSPKLAKSPVSPLKVDEPEEDKLKSRRETTNSFEEEWYLIESQDLMSDQKCRDDPRYAHIKWIIFPDDRLKFIWDIIITINLLFTVTFLPFILSFLEDPALGYITACFISDGIWVIDIILTFFLAYEDKEDKLITSRKKIFLCYLKGWLIIDILSVLPFEYMFGLKKSFNSLIRLAKLHKLTKFIRISKFVRMLRFFKEGNKFARFLNVWLKLTQGVERLFLVLLFFIFFSHIGACIWYLQADLSESPTSWIMRDEEATKDNVFYVYISSLYYVIATTVTVGYGDIHAGNTLERVVVLVFMFIGVFIYSFIIGTLSSIILSRDERSRELEKKLNTLIEMRQKFNLDSHIFNKVKKAIKLGYNRNEDDKINFLNELPMSLRTRLSLIMHKDLLIDIDFFKNRPARFLAHIGPYLRLVSVRKNEYVCTEGEYANEMYFIKSGTIEIVLKEFNNFPFMLIDKGYFFGEIDLLFSETRKYSYRAQTDGQLLVINKNDFTKMFFQEFPDIGAEIYNNALKRRVRQNTSYKEALSYCQTQAKEKERKIENYRPQLSNLSREKLKIRGKDLLENFMKRSLNQQAEEKEEQEQKEHPIKEEKSESPKKFTLKNIIKFGRGNAEENKDLEKVEKDQGDKSVKNVTEQKLGVSWREDMKEENKGKELLDKEKIEAKEAPKSRGWSLIRKKVKDMKKEARERMAANLKLNMKIGQGNLYNEIEMLKKKAEFFEKSIKQILAVYQSLGLTPESLSRAE